MSEGYADVRFPVRPLTKPVAGGPERRSNAMLGRMNDQPVSVTLDTVRNAAKTLSGVARMTAMEGSRHLSSLVGGPVLFKCENLQRTGSFKLRGAYVRIEGLSDTERAAGVVAASAGNHAQGVALAASLLGVRATVFMPVGAPLPKIAATREYGAQVTAARPGGGRDAAGRPGVRPAYRCGLHTSLRPSRRGGRTGHGRPGDHGAVPQRAHRAGGHRRRRAGGRHRGGGQGAESRGAGDRGAGGGRGGVSALAGGGAAGGAGLGGDDGRRDQGRTARGRAVRDHQRTGRRGPYGLRGRPVQRAAALP